MKRFTLSFLMILLSSVLIYSQSILLVDRDGSADAGFTDCATYYTDALDANGYTYTYYEVTDLTMDGPDLATMQDHEIIIWFTGEGWQNNQTMTDNDEANLATFMDGGGMLFLSAQDYLWDRYSSAGLFSAGEFPYDYLGLREVTQDLWFIDATGTMEGVAGSLAEGMSFTIQDIFTTDKDGLYIDEMVDHVGVDLFNITDPTPEGICAVQYEMRAHKAVFTTGSFAAIDDPTAQANLMQAIINYFMGGGGAGPCYNFDDLTVGGYVAEQLGGHWTTWSGAPGTAEDALVTDAQSNSPSNSFAVDASSVDLVFQLADEPIATGMWMYSHYMYVPTGTSGYFNVQSDPTPGVDWNVELYFDDGGTGSFGGQASGDYTFTHDTWFMVEIMYDLDGGMGYVYFDGEMITEFVNEMTIGGIDYFGSTSGGDPGAHYDDVCFEEYSMMDCYNFDDLTVGGYVAEQLGGHWTTWSGAPGTAEDALVTDAQSNSPSNSFAVDASSVDLVFQLADEPIATGSWLYSHYMYVPTGTSGYFNVQSDPTPGVDWNVELYFDDGGTGSFGGQASGDFTFTHDTWFMVEIMYNLDGGMGYVYFDGEMITEFVNEMTIGGIDYFGSTSGGDPGAHYDDVCFGELPSEFCYNFDDLTVGGYVAEQLGGAWTTWSGAPGTAEDALVTDAQSNSPSNSFAVDASTVDLVFQLADEPINTGKWKYSHYMYVPTGTSGYFNVQSDPTPGVDWNVELYFDDGGTGSFGGQASGDFTYSHDTWFKVEIVYTLPGGTAKVYFDGEMITQFANEMTIGGIDYFGSTSGGDPGAHYDDVCFEDISAPDCDGFDDLTVGGYVADQLGGLWTTWSGATGGAEDAIVSDAVSYSPGNSALVEGTTDLVRLFDDENLTAGKYRATLMIYVEPGFCGYFNLQKDVVPGTEWGFQVQFDVDSVATVDAGAAAAATFNYLPGTWHYNELIVDLDADLAQYWVDGEMIVEWQWTLGTFGNPGANTLGSFNIYAWASAGNDPMAYFDDVCFETLVGVGIGNPVIEVESSEVVIYPNPARENINIVSSERIIDIRIFNQMGQLVEFINTDNKHIAVNTSKLNTGMYVVQVRTEEGTEVRKLLIQ